MKAQRKAAHSQKRPGEGEKQPVEFLPPLRPQRRLLIITSILLGLWVAALIALYLWTVYPRRHPARRTIRNRESRISDFRFEISDFKIEIADSPRHSFASSRSMISQVLRM